MPIDATELSLFAGIDGNRSIDEIVDPPSAGTRASRLEIARVRAELLPALPSSSAAKPQMIDSGMSHIGFRCIVRTAA